MKTAGAAFRALLAETLYDIGYVPSKADPDVWSHPTTKSDGFEYYEVVLCYVDNVLAVSDDPKSTLEGLRSTLSSRTTKLLNPICTLVHNLAKYESMDTSVGPCPQRNMSLPRRKMLKRRW